MVTGEAFGGSGAVPPKWDGAKSDWHEWAFDMKNWMRCQGPMVPQWLEEAANAVREPTLEDMALACCISPGGS